MQILFENPILLFLLIGLISSLLKRNKKEQDQEQRPKQPARPMRPVQPQPVSNSETSIPKEVDSHQSNRSSIEGREHREQSPTQRSQNPLLDIQKRYEERRKLEQETSVSNTSLDRPKYKQEKIKDKPIEERSLELKPEADRLIEGIAWAQILGEPRSKKPHRTMRRY
jgi:DNA mismatch repair ATPase MutL